MEAELVTIFRSADITAADDASAVLDALVDAGLNPAMFTDDFPGVPPGACEVRVPPGEEVAALEVVSSLMEASGEPGEPGHSLDLVEVYGGTGTDAEIEAMSVRSVLDANDIPSVMVNPSQIPTLPFAVRVPAVYYEGALAALEAAREAGPAAAEAAEQATEA